MAELVIAIPGVALVVTVWSSVPRTLVPHGASSRIARWAPRGCAIAGAAILLEHRLSTYAIKLGNSCA